MAVPARALVTPHSEGNIARSRNATFVCGIGDRVSLQLYDATQRSPIRGQFISK